MVLQQCEFPYFDREYCTLVSWESALNCLGEGSGPVCSYSDNTNDDNDRSCENVDTLLLEAEDMVIPLCARGVSTAAREQTRQVLIPVVI